MTRALQPLAGANATGSADLDFALADGVLAVDFDRLAALQAGIGRDLEGVAAFRKRHGKDPDASVPRGIPRPVQFVPHRSTGVAADDAGDLGPFRVRFRED